MQQFELYFKIWRKFEFLTPADLRHMKFYQNAEIWVALKIWLKFDYLTTVDLQNFKFVQM